MKCKTCSPLIEAKHTYKISFLDSDILRAHAWLYPFDQARKMIGISKFNGEYCHYKHQSKMLAAVIEDVELNSGLIFDICFVPTIPEHIKRRGFDHAKVMAKMTSSYMGKNVMHGLEALHVQSQVGKSRIERMSNPKFVCSNSFTAENLILLDDVATTRSTLFQAATALKMAGVNNVIALTLSYNSNWKNNL